MELNLSNPIAGRNTKTVYRDNDKTIKLFVENYSKANVLNEALIQSRVEENTDLSISKLIEVTKVQNRWALVTEYIDGTPLDVLMKQHPEKEEEYLMTRIRQLTAAKERLGSQIDRLDCSDRHYEQKYTDMQNRINSLYDEIAEATENLETVQTQIKAIKEQKISQKRIFEFLELFDIIYNEFTEMEKKEFLHSFIKKIEIYPEPLENGQILKSIQFRFPVYYQGNEADMFIPNFENTVENVALLEREP